MTKPFVKFCILNLVMAGTCFADNQFSDYIACYRSLQNEASVPDSSGQRFNESGVMPIQVSTNATSDIYLIMTKDGIYRQTFTPDTKMEKEATVYGETRSRASMLAIKLPTQTVNLDYCRVYSDYGVTHSKQNYTNELWVVSDQEAKSSKMKPMIANDDISAASMKTFEDDLKAKVASVFSTYLDVSRLERDNLDSAKQDLKTAKASAKPDQELVQTFKDNKKEGHRDLKDLAKSTRTALSTCAKVPFLKDLAIAEDKKFDAKGVIYKGDDVPVDLGNSNVSTGSRATNH